MLRRLIGLVSEQPLHFRHEPSFSELNRQLAPLSNPGPSGQTQLSLRQQPGRRAPTLPLEETIRIEQPAEESENVRPRLTTLDALNRIRKNENSNLSEPDLL